MTSTVKCALFDLDGTLVDTSLDLGRATAFVLESRGRVNKWSDANYRSFVGNGAKKLIDRAFEHSLNKKELELAYNDFKAKYNEILLDNAVVYDGVKYSLDALKHKGIRLAVVTNKPNDSAISMVEALFAKDYFDFIIGALDDKPKKPNPYSVKLALNKLCCKADNAVYFGDSDIDVYTAKNAVVKSVACTWGFRSLECLKSAKPDVIINSPFEIAELF